ncbi:kinase-like domain-containing protein [Fomitopsis serialis]|uniref:kinase-like domain-containing protein n=1 Tax=Fomitopsis serialis TaxID=139415 RepID=UPI0020072201|nr:kinase-like domain-containing protein [Neoantrodia serialis]KAH9920130.1 kinase-like domain-containing protein [Neoantrodia serialis]
MTAQPSTTDGQAGTPAPKIRGGLEEHEYFWRDRQPWLQERGYELRPRYRPDWKPSWLGSGRPYVLCEDGQSTLVDTILDATRQSDGLLVTLKAVNNVVHPFEVEIGEFLSSEQMAQDPRNHCVRILDVLRDPMDPKVSIIVMPLLKPFREPQFLTIGEVVAFFKQAIVGLHFMHDHHVAHRDISILNVMMDAVPMYSETLWHPRMSVYTRDFSGPAKHWSRTERPVKYFYIDFGLSRKYNPADAPPREFPIMGGDKSVPEFQGEGYDVASDPFRTDIYYLGNLMRTTFLNKYRGLHFMRELISDMVQDDPEKRPTIAEVEARFDEIYRRLSWWTLRARLVGKTESVIVRAVRGTMHVYRTAKLVAQRRPAIPVPSS